MNPLFRVLPSPEKTVEILALAELGFASDAIVTKVFGEKDPGGATAKVVKAILRNPDAFDPDIDEIAVSRALRGDRKVWEALTHYERREVMLRIAARRDAEKAENTEDRAAYFGPQWSLQKGWHYVSPNGKEPDWLRLLSPMTGWTPRRLAEEAKDFAEARVL